MDDFRLENAIGFLVNRAAMKLKNEILRNFKAHGYDITTEQWAVLASLWEKEDRTQSEIADQLVKDKTNVTRILDLMEKKDLIIRRSDEKDRRSYRIFLTEKGSLLKDKLIPLAKESTQLSIKGINKHEEKELKRLINKIYSNLS
mgnify:CR=1 FL=1